MKIKLTEKQKQEIEELVNDNNFNYVWEICDLFKEFNPRAYKKVLKQVCKAYGIKTSEFDSDNDTWNDMCLYGDSDDLWLDLKNTLLESANILIW